MKSLRFFRHLLRFHRIADFSPEVEGFLVQPDSVAFGFAEVVTNDDVVLRFFIIETVQDGGVFAVETWRLVRGGQLDSAAGQIRSAGSWWIGAI